MQDHQDHESQHIRASTDRLHARTEWNVYADSIDSSFNCVGLWT